MFVFKAVCVFALAVVAGGLLAFALSFALAGDWLTAIGFGLSGVLVALPPKYDPAIRIKEMLGGDR